MGIALTLNAVLYVCDRNWSALVWVLCCAVWVWVNILNCKIVEHQKEVISYLEKHPSWLMCLDAEKRAERYKDDLARALKNMVMLKEANKTLSILNRNLLHNQGKGVKNYAGRNKGSN